MSSPPAELVERLRARGQEHVLLGWTEFGADAREELVRQIDAVDWSALAAHTHDEVGALPPNFEPVPITPAAFTDAEKERGADALRNGKVAALLVAGGQGSRLGSLQPKGLFPAAPLSGAPLYQLHAEKVFALSRRYGRAVPFLVMTSPATDAQTRAYFAEQPHLMYAPDQVRFFRQGTMPAVCAHSGRLLLEAPGRLFLSPNGHGGTLTALADSGLLGELAERGVEHVFYFQVDNPLIKMCDPGFIGRHIAANAEVSSKVIAKDRPDEKVGVLVSANGRCSIIEYTLLPKELAEARDASGLLRYRAGSPAIHLFSVAFLQRVTRTAAGSLPYHTARKAVAHHDPQTGQAVPAPKEPNAVKFERFIFDALPHAERWLAQAGVNTNGHPVEISPLFALDADELAAKVSRLPTLTGPTDLN